MIKTRQSYEVSAQLKLQTLAPPLCPNWPWRAAVCPTWRSPWWSRQRAPSPRPPERTAPSWASASLCSCCTKEDKIIHIRLISFTSSCVPGSRPIRPADAHRLRTLASWLSALNALISNSTAHCCRRGETRMLHQPVRRSCHRCWLVSLNLTFPTSLGAGWRATEHGRLSGNCKEEKQTSSTECRQFSDQIKWNKTASQTACSTNVWTVWWLRQKRSFPLMCQHVSVRVKSP